LAPEQSRSGADSHAEPGWVTLDDGRPMQLATQSARLGARAIDAIIVAVGAMTVFAAVLLGVARAFSDDPSSGPVILGALAGLALAFFLAGAYEVFMTTSRGQTIGKSVLKIAVIGAENGEFPARGASFKRWALPWLPALGVSVAVVPVLGLIVPVLVYFSLIWGDDGQGWHDKAAGTFVVKIP